MRVCIVGLGLIGGSIGLGLVESGFAEHVVGIDQSLLAGEEALRRKAIHELATSPRHVHGVDLWIIATPPGTIAQILKEIGGCMDTEAAITDCASVKSVICEAVPPELESCFVGGHPMAGNDQGSIYNARSDLFRDAKWLLSPTDQTDPRVLDRIRKMIYALDATPVSLPPEAHDEHAAWLSHLPHVLAAILTLQAEDLKLPYLGGGSWRDLTRVAGSDSRLWSEILAMNGPAMDAAIEQTQQWLGHLRSLIASGDQGGLESLLHQAAEARRRQNLDHAQVQSDA